MEDRVKTILEKEHSKRFRAMCHRNEGLAQQSKSLQDFYDREKKKSLYNIETREAELQQKIVTLSQERFVNGLVNQLTELAFSNTDLTADNLIKAVSSLSSVGSDDPEVPRYLRMETNAFHSSEMSLGSNDVLNSAISVVPPIDQDHEQNDQSENKQEPTKIKSKRTKSSISDDAVKNVVDRLTDFYDIDKLKFLTQVMLKTLQNNERTRCEEKMKLIYNLNKFLNEGGRDAKLPSRKSRKESLPKIKGNDTFLFLKADRQQELRDEAELEAKKLSKPCKVEKSRPSLHERNHPLPSLPDVKKFQEKERRNSLSSNMTLTQSSSLNSQTLHDKPSAAIEETESGEFNDLMKIYLKLGHGTGVLKLPDNSNRATTRAKQQFWLRKDLRKIPVVPKNGVQDLRVVMKNCRYLRFPKDMAQDMKH